MMFKDFAFSVAVLIVGLMTAGSVVLGVVTI